VRRSSPQVRRESPWATSYARSPRRWWASSDDHQVPTGIGGGLGFLAGAREPLHRGDHQRVAYPRGRIVVGRFRLRCLAVVLRTVRIHQGEEQVELVEQLGEPLHGEVLGATTRHRCTRPACSSPESTRPASMVFPSPTSSASTKRGCGAERTWWATLTWCGFTYTREAKSAPSASARRSRSSRTVSRTSWRKSSGVAPAAGSELLCRPLPRHGAAQVRLAPDLRLLPRDLHCVAVEIVRRSGKRAQHLGGPRRPRGTRRCRERSGTG